jgi:hypothetical protein
VRERDIDAWDALQRQMYQIRGEPAQPAECAVVAAARGDAGEFDRWLRALESGPLSRQSPVSAAARLALGFHDFTRADRLARVALLPQYSVEARLDAHLLLAELAVASDRWREALPHLDAAARIDTACVRVFRAVLATVPTLQAPPGELTATRASVRAWDPTAVVPGGASRLVTALLPHLRLYLLGLLSARLGDHADAMRLAGELDGLDAPARAAAVPRDLARTLRADVAWRERRPAAVVETLAPVRGEVPFELLFRAGRDRQPEYTYAFSQGHARWLRARSLQRLGRDEEALRWLDTFLLVPDELLYLGAVRHARAEANDRLGRARRAQESPRPGSGSGRR